jgi:hypothetical protein
MKTFTAKVINDNSAIEVKYSPWVSSKGYKKLLVNAYSDLGGGLYVYGTSLKDGAGNPTGGAELASVSWASGATWTYVFSNVIAYDYVRVLIDSSTTPGSNNGIAFITLADEV